MRNKSIQDFFILIKKAVNKPVPHGVLAVGEVGLTGEIRRVSGTERRIRDAANLGFTKFVVPKGKLNMEKSGEAIRNGKLKERTRKIVATAMQTARSRKELEQQPEAIAALQRVKDAGQLVVKSVERKEACQEPPLLYDLTTLQKEANTKLNFSADKTLSIAQSLYEKKVMSYPRTGSRYIPEDVFDEMPERVALLGQYFRFAGYAAGLDGTPLNRRSVNDGVTDNTAFCDSRIFVILRDLRLSTTRK